MPISLQHRRTRLAVILVLVIVTLLAATRSAQAQGIVGGNVIPAGTVFDNDAFLNGGDIVLDGTVVGDVLAVGRTVTINGDVEGSLVALAETVVVNGAIDGSVYTGALTFEVGDPATIGRSAYFVGARLVTEPESLIDRDLVAGTLGAQLGGSVGREVKASIGLVVIANRIMEAFDINPNWSIFSGLGSNDAPEAGNSASAAGALVPTGFALSEVAKNVQPAGGQLVHLAGQNLAGQNLAVQDEDPQAGESNPNAFGAWSLERLRLLVQYLIVGALAAWIVPARFYRWNERLRARPFASALYGFVGSVTGFAGVTIVIAIVMAITFALSAVAMRGLATTTWTIGLSGTLFAFSIFLFFALMMSKVIVSYWGGRLILERLAPRAAQHWIWPLLLGLIIYVLLRGIPSIGWVIGFIVSIFGLGAAILALNRRDVYAWKTAGEEEE
jgi:hypothetical protein